MSTDEQISYKKGCEFINREAQSLARTEGVPSLSCSWDGGTMAIVRGQHILELSTNNKKVEVSIEHDWLIQADKYLGRIKSKLSTAIQKLK